MTNVLGKHTARFSYCRLAGTKTQVCRSSLDVNMSVIKFCGEDSENLVSSSVFFFYQYVSFASFLYSLTLFSSPCSFVLDFTVFSVVFVLIVFIVL